MNNENGACSLQLKVDIIISYLILKGARAVPNIHGSRDLQSQFSAILFKLGVDFEGLVLHE